LTALDVNYLGQPHVIAACLLEGRGGGVALVDPGPTTALPGLRAALAAHGRSLADVEAILLTHIHLDHAGATGAIVREHPSIRVHVHERGAPHMIDPTRLMRSASRLYGADMDRLWGEMVPVPEANVQALAGGERIAAAGRELRVVYTPGHASHHVCYFDPDTRTALVGDTGGIRIGAWPVVLPPTPPPDIDLDAWEASLQAILAWEPASLFVTHFGQFHDPADHAGSLRVWLAELHELAASILADASLDDDGKTRVFAARLEERIASEAGAEAAAACARAVPFAHCWLGLRRYLSQRA
jgi:glyoxylase-like metal-dependent hydrolase (beta-lactamase superfamily II)